MTKLLRSRRAGKFLTADGNWTDSIKEARVIRDHLEALAVAAGLKELEPELYFAVNTERLSPEWDFAVALH